MKNSNKVFWFNVRGSPRMAWKYQKAFRNSEKTSKCVKIKSFRKSSRSLDLSCRIAGQTWASKALLRL